MLLFTNGTIHTMDPANPTPEAVLIGDDGRIRAAGRAADLDAPGVRRIDLGGRTLLPGFNDAHVHVWKLGLLLTVQVDARSAVAPDIASIIGASTSAPWACRRGRGLPDAATTKPACQSGVT